MGNDDSIRTKIGFNEPNEHSMIPEVIIHGQMDDERKKTDKFQSFQKIDQCLSNVLKSICKIEIDTKGDTKMGTGFLMKFRISSEMFFCLVSNAHVLTKQLIEENENIIIYYDSEHASKKIKLDPKKRYIQNFRDLDLDITVVEIIEEDGLADTYFLLPENESLHNSLLNSQIYIPQYMKGRELVNSRGKVTEINNYEITHLANTDKGSSGSPIFLENSVRVIGIHKGGNREGTENYGDIIYPAIVLITNNLEKKRNSGKYENGKFIYEDGKYYIGQLKNNIPNGKGIKYYSNGNIMYDGDFVNGKFEGNGKCIFQNGYYYIGQWKNGLRNGEGILYYKNGNIMYEGEFVNDVAEGNGMCMLEDGEYYIGQMKNGLRNGNGIEYYRNGKIRYEGDFVNNKYEGFGTNYMRNGDYYIGQMKNGLRNGKGIYYKNGKIFYEGDYVNDVEEGNGKMIWKNGEYYIGQWKHGKLNGKGTLYYKNGKIRYDGDFVNDKMDGYGIYNGESGKYYANENGELIYEEDLVNHRYKGNGTFIMVEGYSYVGQFKNNLQNGKGIKYDINGNIKYEGDFVNGEFDGDGQYYHKDGTYYIGQFKHNVPNGNGILFNSDGTIKNQGNWINGIFVGN